MSVVPAVKALSDAVKVLQQVGIVRSRAFICDLGEWYVEQLYCGKRAKRTQKGWDVELADGIHLQVKLQSHTDQPSNQWNYLGSSNPDFFDRLIAIILTDDFRVRDLYDVPVTALPSLLKVGKEGKPLYRWSDLEKYRTDPKTLPGYPSVAGLIV